MDINAAMIAAAGGALIGLAASLLFLGLGRIAGISGIAARALSGEQRYWQLAFLVGLLVAGVVASITHPEQFAYTTGIGEVPLLIAGLLVGFGTRLGSGCTSGHGVCGLSRGSLRSLTATLTFMLFGGLTVFVVRHVVGGAG